MDERSSPAPASTSGRGRLPTSVLLVGVGIAALIAFAVIVVMTAKTDPTDYAPGTPESAFQAYYQAWEARDVEGAYGHLSSAIRSDIDLAAYRRFDAEQSHQRDQDRRVVLLGVDIDGDHAVLDLRIDEFSESGFGGDRYSHERSIPLVHEDGAWRIDEPIVGLENMAFKH